MKRFSLISPFLAALVAISVPTIAPNVVFAHVGHGDEFQAKGGVQRVPVNAATDQQLGIEVKPIAPPAGGGTAVMIPVTALVDSDGKQLVFVQYENFYEPVPVTTRGTKGDLIEITQGLSLGEKLVTQGSLTLYAESRKTKTTPAASPKPNEAHAQADAKGIPHSHDPAGNMTKQQPSNATPSKSEFPVAIMAATSGLVLLLIGGIMVGNRKKKSTFSNKKGGF